MKKALAIASCLVLLSGCAKSFESDLPQRIETYLKQQSTQMHSLGANKSKYYYKYYLPLDIGIRDSTQLGEMFVKNDSLLLMNFNPSSLVIYHYYNKDEEAAQKEEKERQQAREDGNTEVSQGENDAQEQSEPQSNDTQTSATTSLTEKNLSEVVMKIDSNVIEYEGTYQANTGEYYPYKLTLIQGNDDYLLYLDGSVVEFYCVSPLADISSDINSMFLIMKSISFDLENVLENFSMKNATSSKQQSIDTLQQNLPSSGSMPELLEQMEQLTGKR